jgi:hypothetical protein
MQIRTLLTLIVGGLAAFFLPREQAHGTFAELDRGHVAWLLANRNQPAPALPLNIILARLDDLDHPESERQFETWPPTPIEWSGLMDEISLLQPRTVVIPAANAWATKEVDPLLAKSCQAIAGLQLGTRAEAQGSPQATALPQFANVQGDRGAIPQFALVTGEQRLNPLGHLAISQVDLSDDPRAKPSLQDGNFRLPLLFRQGDLVVPSLLLQALIQQANLRFDQVKITLGQALTLPGLPEIPIDEAGGFHFHVLPINEQPLRTCNADTFKMDAAQRERFLGKEDPVRQILLELKDSMVWLGEDHRESKRFQLPDGRSASLAELSARALLAMHSGRNVAPISSTSQTIAMGLIILYGLWLSRLNRSRLWKWTILGLLLLGLGSLLTFQSNGQWLPVGPGLVLLGILWLVNFLVPPTKTA